MKKLLIYCLLYTASVQPALFYVYNFKISSVHFLVKQASGCDDLQVTIPPITSTNNIPQTFGTDQYKENFLSSNKECGVVAIKYRLKQNDPWRDMTNGGYTALNDLAARNGTGDSFNGVFHIVVPKKGDIRVQETAPAGY